MSDLNQRAARGQAYNQAMDDARQAHKTSDIKYVTERFLYHLEMAKLFQIADVKQLASVVDNPKLLELIKELNNDG